MTFVSIEYSIKSKLARVTLSCRTQLDDKSHLLFVYTVTASTSISCWILIIDLVEQPIIGFNSISGNLKGYVKSRLCWVNADLFLTSFGQKVRILTFSAKVDHSGSTA